MPAGRASPGRPLARVLADDPILAAWNRRLRDEAKVTATVCSELPRALAPHVAAWLPEAGRIELVATTGAVAAALRLRLPAVRTALEREGWDFRDFRLRVQPGSTSRRTVNTVVRQWDRAQAPALAALADSLPEGPLKSAVAGWLKRSGRRGRGEST